MLNIADGKINLLGQEMNYDDLMAKLDYHMAEEIENALGDTIELWGKKIKVHQISRKTLNKISALYVAAKKDVDGELIDNQFNRNLDIRAASLIMLDGFLNIKQKLFYPIHWRWLESNSKYNTYILNGLLKRVLNDVELLFFYNSVGLLKSTAMERMKVKPQK